MTAATFSMTQYAHNTTQKYLLIFQCLPHHTIGSRQAQTNYTAQLNTVHITTRHSTLAALQNYKGQQTEHAPN